jgi:beta-glucosidase
VRLEYFEMVGGASVGFGVASTEASTGRATKTLAASADAVILCVGFNDTSESEGSDRTFRLPPGQDSLIRAISGVNKSTIVVLTSGGGVEMNEWIGQAPALLQTWYPGQEGGTALAQILFGDESPSGKLPASFERLWEENPVFHSYYPAKGEKHVPYSEGVFVGYRHFDRANVKPLFAFGYGLSYTTFEYSKLSVTPTRSQLNEPVTVSFDLKNTGPREGAEVAELYVGAAHPSVPRPIKELKGFARVNLKPGETRHVSIMLDRRAFAFYDVNRKDWNAESGDFSVLVGASSDDVRLRGTFTLLNRE